MNTVSGYGGHMESYVKKLAKYYKPYKKSLVADIICSVISAGIALAIPFIIRNTVSGIGSGADPLTIIILMGLLLTGLVVIRLFCDYYIACAGHVMGAKMEADMRRDIFAHYQKLSFSFYDEQKTGQLLSRVTNDLYDISEMLHHGPETMILCSIKIIGALVIMLVLNPLLALFACVLVPVMVVFAYFCNRRMEKAFAQNRIKIGDVNAQIEDSLSGIRVVKSFANEWLENRKFGKGNEAFLQAKKNSYKFLGIFHSGLNAFTAMIMVVIMVAGGIMIAAGTLTVADLLAFLLYVNVLTEPVMQLIDFTEMFQNGLSGFKRFEEIMDTLPDIEDKEGAKELKGVKGDVTFEHVSFKYGTFRENVFENINVNVPAGGYYAIVGPSGIGKTTLVSLLPRFYEVSSGRILIDGTDINDVTLRSLRDSIGIVQQDVYLFMGTVYENILYGRPDATREEVVAAAKNANAHDFIMSLPNGYDTDIGQRGVKLSGGQKQRISIARVFLKNPPILIFDEATSALDSESERVVQESMDRLAENRTTFVIAHRLSTVRNAEKILVMSGYGINQEEPSEFFKSVV